MDRNTLRPDTPAPVNPSSKSNGSQQNKQKSVSPLTNELLIASRKGYTNEVKRILAEGGGSLAQSTQDRVS